MKSVKFYIAIASIMALTACGQGGQSDDGGLLGIPSGTYAVDKSHTYITLSYFHQGLAYPLLRATEVDGELELDNNKLESSKVTVAVGSGSIRTNLDYFDKELASRKFFHADKFPYITLATHSYTPFNETTGELTGFITIRDITKPIVFAVTINGAMEHPMLNKPVIGISANGSLKRSDFELDRFIPMVGDEVQISIEAEFLHGANDGSAAAVEAVNKVMTNADPASLQVSAELGAER